MLLKASNEAAGISRNTQDRSLVHARAYMEPPVAWSLHGEDLLEHGMYHLG